MKNHIGILVSMTPETFNHKVTTGKYSDGRYCYWTTKRFPTRFVTEENVNKEWRLWTQVNGKVMGYFIIDDFKKDNLLFDGNSFVAITYGEQMRKQKGWKYYQGD